MGLHMTQAEIAAAIASDAGISKSAGAAVLKSLVALISNNLKKGQDVRIAGLGTFKVAKRPARKARNPRTGEMIRLKASKQPKFTPSATLRNTLNPTREAGKGSAQAKAKAAAKSAAPKQAQAAASASPKKAQVKAKTAAKAARKTTVGR